MSLPSFLSSWCTSQITFSTAFPTGVSDIASPETRAPEKGGARGRNDPRGACAQRESPNLDERRERILTHTS